MLTSVEIERQLQGVKYFIGVYAVDQLPLVTVFPASLVINTDPSSEGGEHWVAVHLRQGGKADYFDSFGFPPLVPMLQQYLNLYGRRSQKYNRCTMQDVNSTRCGDYCICYVKCIANGMTMTEFVNRFASGAFCTPEENERKLMSCVKTLSR